MLNTLALGYPGPMEMIILAGLGLLIFGRRLPEVGRNIGKGIVEFKRGLKEAEESINHEVSNPTPTAPPAAQSPVQATLPPANTQPQMADTAPQYKFDPYTGKPLEQATTTTSQTSA
jgi:sec-independent protein translocase protein TatA